MERRQHYGMAHNSTKESGKPVVLLPAAQIKVIYKRGAFRRADLIQTQEGWQLCLHTDKEILTVAIARRERDRARTWQSVDRALSYISRHFGSLTLIHLDISMKESD